MRTAIPRSRKAYTTFFRKHFIAPFSASELWLKLVFDDGVAVYLNGVPVVARHLPPEPSFDTRAITAQKSLRDSWFTFHVDPGLLRTGTNTLAVEIHQNSRNSPDMRFDAQLIAVPNAE